MTRYLLVDAANLFYRSLHMANNKNSDIEERVAYSIHSTLQSIGAMDRDHRTGHIVFALEGYSWRKKVYPPYKATREVAKQARTEKEQQESEAYATAFKDLVEFLWNRTNSTCLQHPELEADDLIAGWIQSHPDDEHIIISTDTDYYQLLAENVTQFSGVAQELHTIHGIYDHKGKRVLNKKTKLPKPIPDPQYILFEKCIRGDSSDNVFSAYPRVRTKGSSKRVGIQEAYADKETKGFNWNNLQLQRWVDPDGVEHRVLDDYKRNVMLIDLTAQPPEIRQKIDETIDAVVPKANPMVGAYFLKFCGKYNLVRLSDNAQRYADALSVPYIKRIKELS